MNLTTIAQNTNKYIKPFLAVLVFVILIILIALKYFSSNQQSNLPLLDKPYFSQLATKPTYLYNQNLQYVKNSPKSLPLYTIQNTQNFLNKADFFASKLGFSDKPANINDLERGAGKGYSNLGGALIIFQGELTYQKDYKNIPPTSINIDNLKSKSLEYLKGLGLDTNIISDPEISYTYLAEDTAETQDPSRSGLINLTYNQSLEGYKVFSPTYQTKVTLNSVGNIMGFTYKNLEIGQKQTSYSIISAKAASDLVIGNKGQLFQVSGQSNVSTLKQLPPVQLQTMYLAYFYNPQRPEIAAQPIWIFNGEALVNNTKIYVKIAVPAIQDKYFKTNLP